MQDDYKNTFIDKDGFSDSEIRKAQRFSYQLMTLTIIYTVVFALASVYLNSGRLGAVAFTTSLLALGYFWSAKTIARNKLHRGIVLMSSFILIALFTLSLILPEQVTTWAVASFIPFALTLQFTRGNISKYFAIGGVLVAIFALIIYYGLGWTSGFPPSIMGWLNVAGTTLGLAALAAIMIQIRSIFEERSKQLSEAIHETSELRIKKEVAEKSTILKADFLASMSHEIRTPMNAIIGITALLSKGELDSEKKELVSNLEKSGIYLLTLINDILDFSKLDSGKFEIDNQVINLADQMNDTLDLVEKSAQAKGLKLIRQFKLGTTKNINADSARLRQIVLNLLSNAIKFTNDGSVACELKTTPVGTNKVSIEVKIKDTGIGMDRNQIQKLFQPFVQADISTHRQFGGTGLGLAISQRLAVAMGGSITIDSQLGYGSVFTFAFETTTSDKEIVLSAATKFDPAFAQRFPLKILVAEDNEVNQLVIRKILESLGYKIEIVTNGQAAIEAATTNAYDVILMDMQMPIMNGDQATLEIKKRLGDKSPRIIALTANATKENQKICKEIGMSGFLTKPVTVTALMTALSHNDQI